MNPMQKSYRAFIESVCTEFECTGAIRPLQEGFSALCEARYTYPTQKLHHYLNHTVRRPAELDKQAGQIVSEANKHKGGGRRVNPVDARVLLASDWIYNDFINGLRHGIELVNSGNADEEFCLDTADEEPLDDDILADICSDCSSDDLPFTAGNILAWGITHERAGGSNKIERSISAALAGGDKFRILMACAAHCPHVLMVPNYTGACREFVERELSDEYLTDKTTFTYKGTVNDIWLVHGTGKESARNIAMHGFDRGSKLGSLAYNTSYNEEDDVRYNGDYLFAYALDSLSPSHGAPLGRFFGGGAIVFKSSAVAAYHGNDAISTPGEPEDLQYIFDKSVPDSCYLVIQADDGNCAITGEGDRQLFKGTDARCLEWLKKNSDTYAHMMYKWKSRRTMAKMESMMAWNANSLCESGDRTSGSAWDTVERIHIYHAADPRMGKDIKLDSLWATRQKDSVTRGDVIGRFMEDAEDFNKWLATSEDGGAFITSASIKFKDEPDAITVDIPCPGGVTPYKYPTSTQQAPGKLDIPCPGDGQSADINTHGNNLYESVEDTALTQFGEAMVIAKDSYDRSGGMDYEPEEGEDEESKYAVVKDAVDCIYGEMDAQLKSKGTVTVYRALYAKEAKDIRKDYLGESWSLYEDAAIEFGSHNGSNFILKAEAGLDAIDLERTWEAAGACADLDEYEVCIEDTDRLKDLQIGRIVKRTAVYDVNDRMGSDYREIGVGTKFVPQKNQSSGCPEVECQLRQPTTDELYKFIMKATKEEHQLRGDWDSNHEEIGADSDRFIREIQAGEVQSLTDGRGLVAYGLDSGKMIIYDLYVLPEYRNAGVGGTLLDKVTEMAGGRPVALTVNSMNAPAIHLYRNHGFREVGTVSYNGVELLRMERQREKHD